MLLCSLLFIADHIISHSHMYSALGREVALVEMLVFSRILASVGGLQNGLLSLLAQHFPGCVIIRLLLVPVYLVEKVEKFLLEISV